MRNFSCACGMRLFFENTRCTGCGRPVRFDPVLRIMVSPPADARRCANDSAYHVCNWLPDADDPGDLCRSCRITRITPNLSSRRNLRRWRIMETAKRRLLYTLMQLELPVAADPGGGHPALAFEFLEDRGSNPLVAEQYVHTGHATGVITINVSEADDVQREITRSLMNEAYRTPLGHCRHESGHYFYDRLVRNGERQAEFRALFGDPDVDYDATLAEYYAAPPAGYVEAGYISLYASSHPLEDWAECWAHYLHIEDTLETAVASGLFRERADRGDFDGWIRDWLELAVNLNELNRSMGLADAYPFILTGAVIDKLRLVSAVAGHRAPGRNSAGH